MSAGTSSNRLDPAAMAISLVLRIGIIASGTCMIIAGVAYAFARPAPPLAIETFAPRVTGLTFYHGSIGEIASAAVAPLFGGVATVFTAAAWMQLGVLGLVCTPLLRVIASLLLFIGAKDRTYILCTALVLAALMYSLFGAGGGRG